MPYGVLTLAMCIASPAVAGMNLSWNDCGAFGTSAAPLVCASNVGRLAFIVSATLPRPLPPVNAYICVIEVQTSGAALSPWWDMRNGTGCRPTSCSTTSIFTGLTNCADPWGGEAVSGFEYADYFSPDFQFGPNRARLRAAAAVQPEFARPLDAGTEYYLGEFFINMAKTVGLGACAGCSNDATISLSQIELFELDGIASFVLTTPDNGACIHTNSPPSAGQCSALPARNHTWGSLKAMYH